MRRIALVITFVAGLIASAFAQKTEIEAVNAKWIEFFNKGDFAGIASVVWEKSGSDWKLAADIWNKGKEGGASKKPGSLGAPARPAGNAPAGPRNSTRGENQS